MIEEKIKLCKSKKCNNPVLDGKYCENCRQKSKEKRDKILAAVGGAAILGVGAIKKKAPEIAAKTLKLILRG